MYEKLVSASLALFSLFQFIVGILGGPQRIPIVVKLSPLEESTATFSRHVSSLTNVSLNTRKISESKGYEHSTSRNTFPNSPSSSAQPGEQWEHHIYIWE